MATIIRNREKLKALVHYVISKCDNPKLLGSIKLNKVLWVSDLSAYTRWGQPITGEHYVKQQFGPVASTVGIMRELQNEGKIVVRERETSFGHSKTDYFSLARPENVSQMFTADEISLVDDAIGYVCRHTAMQISDMTHDIIWQLAEIGEEIPYEAMWASRFDAVTKDDVARAKKAIASAKS